MPVQAAGSRQADRWDHRAFTIIVLLLCAFALPFTDAGSQYWMQVAATIGPARAQGAV